jgi:predicted Zn-dependent protease with MMP-like domain
MWGMSKPVSDAEFEAMVQAAIDQGAEHHAYGEYSGDGIARDFWPDRILIFRDTLVHDFGHDRKLLAAEVERTVRHELGHHIGFQEKGVRDLGL